ncbi:MAG: hypothetical protein WBV82_03985 [Myxococcaceae bacterium]
MPEKSRERRVHVARKEGRSTAIKASDVGMAKGLSRHAAKKSSHVLGMRRSVGRSVDVKSTPGRGKGKAAVPTGPLEHAYDPMEYGSQERTTRIEGMNRERPAQRELSQRTPTRIEMEKQRRQK